MHEPPLCLLFLFLRTSFFTVWMHPTQILFDLKEGRKICIFFQIITDVLNSLNKKALRLHFFFYYSVKHAYGCGDKIIFIKSASAEIGKEVFFNIYNRRLKRTWNVLSSYFWLMVFWSSAILTEMLYFCVCVCGLEALCVNIGVSPLLPYFIGCNGFLLEINLYRCYLINV